MRTDYSHGARCVQLHQIVCGVEDVKKDLFGFALKLYRKDPGDHELGSYLVFLNCHKAKRWWNMETNKTKERPRVDTKGVQQKGSEIDNQIERTRKSRIGQAGVLTCYLNFICGLFKLEKWTIYT